MAVSPRFPAEHAVACRHAEASECMMLAPGHELHLMQRRLAAATPGKWVDAFVGAADRSGRVELFGLTGEPVGMVWNHGGIAVEPGTPVALHAVYNVLAVGDAWFNVRVDSAV